MVIVALLFVVLFWLFFNGFTFYEAAEFLYSFAGMAELAVLCGLTVLFFVLLYLASGKLFMGCGTKTLKIFRYVMTAGMIAIQCYFLFYVRSAYKWDSGFVIGGAASLAETGKVAEEAFYYLSVYPNQNTFVVITAVLIKIGNLLGIPQGARPLLFNVFNTVCLDTAIFLVIPILKKWKKDLKEWEVCRIFLILLCNPFLYLGVSYYYTITLSLPLTMGFLYLIAPETVDDEKKKRWSGMVLAGILLGVGFELRATAVIFGIAALAVGIWMLWEKGKKAAGRILFQMAVIGFAACISAGGLSAAQKAYIGIDTTDTAFPTSHWLMMSLTMPGGHNGEDEAYTASFPTKEEKEEAVALRMKEKLDAMSGKEYLELVTTKVKNNFGTGTNGYTIFLAEALGTGGIYEAVLGGHKDFAVLWHQGYYLFLLMGILLCAGSWGYKCFRYKETDFYGFLLLLGMFGAVLFYVLWEASEQYSIPFMFMMSCLAFGGLSEFEKVIDSEKTYKGAAFLAFLGAAVIVFWGAVRFGTFTDTPIEQSHPCATQILANRSYPVDEGQELVQSLRVKEPFNRLIVQWRNPSMENSTAVYRIQLREQGGSVLFEEEIRGEGTGYNGAGIYDFERFVPGDICYEIGVKKISGRPEDDLEFVVYDMYGYTPYPGGQLYIRESDGGDKEGAKEIVELDASLLFSLSEEKQESYALVPEYIIFVCFLFLIFLFMGFWCKLKRVPFTEEER